MTDRSGIDQLVALRDELNSKIDAVLQSNDSLPSLNCLDNPLLPVSGSARQALGVAKEIVALLRGSTAVMEKAMGFHVTSALRVAVECHVVETLREAAAEGKKSLPAQEIAKSSNIEPTKLARILRLLAAHHVFVEAEPNSFALNRPALFLDTGKSVKELRGSKDWFSGTNGIAAWVNHLSDTGLKGSASLAETLLDPKTSHSFSVAHSATVRGNNLDGPIWAHYAKPGNEHLASRFGAAMRAVKLLGGAPDKAGYPYHELPEGATLVDVGSGVGGQALIFRKTAPQLNLVLQDLPEVINGEAHVVWAKEDPEAIKTGRVKLVAHDFFKPQPVKGADVYFLRVVIHDWSTDPAVQILRHLSDAASPSSRLVLMEQTYTPVPPSGRVPSAQPYLLDMQMLVGPNGQERMKEQYEELGKKAGWKLEKVWRSGEGGQDGAFRHYEFSPLEAK